MACDKEIKNMGNLIREYNNAVVQGDPIMRKLVLQDIARLLKAKGYTAKDIQAIRKK